MKPQLHWKIPAPSMMKLTAEVFIGTLTTRVGWIEDHNPWTPRYRAWCAAYFKAHYFVSEGAATIAIEEALNIWFAQITAGASPEGSISYLELEVKA